MVSRTSAKRILNFLSIPLLLVFCRVAHADARFDLTGPSIDVRITRAGQTLDIAQVPNLQPGDRIWLHPDLPSSQSVRYLLICVFLRGTTNPPPDSWFTRIETWDRHVREEGAFVTVPKDAQQAVLFLAPETGGDFNTLKAAVKGSPGTFVRADQDLVEAGFEQARIEKYLSLIRRVPPGNPEALQKHSELLASTLALKPNDACFKQPVDLQFSCLTQSGSQTLLDDSQAQSVVSALSSGPGSDFINQASYTQLAGGGDYSAYVGTVVDLFRIMGSLHTAHYQYIPAIAFPEGAALNLRLNAPPSFRNPKSVLVIGLPAVQKAVLPPLRPADANQVSCLLKPSLTLPIEGAPLVFSTDFAHGLYLHLNTPPGAPAEPDIPLVPDAYQGGLVLQHQPEHHIELRDPLLAQPISHSTDHAAVEPSLGQPGAPADAGAPAATAPNPNVKPEPKPVLITGTVEGYWGFDSYTGPTLELQQLPGQDWHIVPSGASDTGLIAGHAAELLLASTGTACVDDITALPSGSTAVLKLKFKPQPRAGVVASDSPTAQPPGVPEDLLVTLPLDKSMRPGDLHLSIQQYGQPAPNQLSTRTFAEPAHVTQIDLHAGDKTMRLTGTGLDSIQQVNVGDLAFKPSPGEGQSASTLDFSLPDDAPTPPTRDGQNLSAKIVLNDGRVLSSSLIVSTPLPSITLLSKTADPPQPPVINLTNPADLPLSSELTFTLRSQTPFPRDGEIEIATLDGTLRAVLTLAPSGGLLLQDPHIVVATLDPLRSFGPSAFGELHMRALFPSPASRRRHETETPVNEGATGADLHANPADEAFSAGNAGGAPGDIDAAVAADTLPASGWLPLVTIVRLPTLTSLDCPADASQPCTLSGTNLFLLEGVSANPDYSDATPVPDGFTGSTLSVPHPLSAGTLFLKLRDDPSAIDSANIPAPGSVSTPPPEDLQPNALQP